VNRCLVYLEQTLDSRGYSLIFNTQKMGFLYEQLEIIVETVFKCVDVYCSMYSNSKLISFLNSFDSLICSLSSYENQISKFHLSVF